MSAPRKTLTGLSSSSTPLSTGPRELDSILPGEIVTVALPEFVEASHVDELLATARRRFNGKNGIWTVGASQVRQFSDEARAKMRAGFLEFAAGGGKTVILICTYQPIISLFRLWVGPRQGLDLKIVEDVKTSLEMSRQLRGVPLKPVPPK